jgi:hypothetical protein
MSDRNYAAILAALTSGTTVTYGALSRGERMHVQSMRRDGLAVVTGPDGAVLDSLAGEPADKRAWTVRVTERGRACADVLAPFTTSAPVVGRMPRHAAPAAPATVDVATCGAPTRKGTPCTLPVGPSGACRTHGSPVVTTYGESHVIDDAVRQGASQVTAPDTVVGEDLADAIARAVSGALAAALAGAR